MAALAALGQSLLDWLDVLSAGAFLALAFGVFDGVALAKVFERVGAAVTVKEKVIASAFGSDEAEAFVCDDFFNGSLGHILSVFTYFGAVDAFVAVVGRADP
ncbi:MAG: hypothetical protein ACI8XO_002058 [Verrucomicrobiales bacterium]|jgi:hypothetical protein